VRTPRSDGPGGGNVPLLDAGRTLSAGFSSAGRRSILANLQHHGVVGPYKKPKTRLPGAAAAPEISSRLRPRIFIIMRKSPRRLRREARSLPSFGTRRGITAPRRDLRQGPTKLVSDLATSSLIPSPGNMTVTSIHRGWTRRDAIRANTVGPCARCANVKETPRATDDQEAGRPREVQAVQERARRCGRKLDAYG